MALPVARAIAPWWRRVLAWRRFITSHDRLYANYSIRTDVEKYCETRAEPPWARDVPLPDPPSRRF